MMKKTREESLKKKKNTDGGTFINLKCGWDFPGSPVVKTPGSQCRGPRFDSWFRELDPACHI